MKKGQLKELYEMMFPDYPDIVTVAQLQKMLGVSRHLAYDLISDGYIRGVKIGNAYKVPKINVINYVLSEDTKEAI
ncbi:MAG TPA: helix-turn-helix domain-containing protein [Clostridia bacterium]|nr:helix-turn-helix domain-containing protein [Clostridia bacterium]